MPQNEPNIAGMVKTVGFSKALDRLPVPRTHPAWLEAERALIPMLAAVEKEAAAPSSSRRKAAAKRSGVTYLN